ncbi:hypothetical protein K440DRAFT_662427 [Wilcoxina mikolae CBS 423.85]|nr:hypothetical protein K440DRAFT_662427 [Wilcoxina mikolae CBS 423.85]
MKPTFFLLTLTTLISAHQTPLKITLLPPVSSEFSIMASSFDNKPSGTPLLGDIIPLDKQISIFSGFTRSIESISELLSNRNENTTVLAPSNTAVSRLPRKPWEDPNDEGAGGNVFSEIYKGLQGEDRATRNLRRFVEAHCVAASPWEEGTKVKTVEGVEVWWEEIGGRKKIMPEGVDVLQVKDEVANGQLWIIDGVVNYDR